jgi:pimeloyl-ACP methyl ester carboxylesterase
MIHCPVLLLSGDRDPFAQVDLLRAAATQLPHHELVIYPGLRHGIGSRLDDALDRIAAFARRVSDSVHSPA